MFRNQEPVGPQASGSSPMTSAPRISPFSSSARSSSRLLAPATPAGAGTLPGANAGSAPVTSSAALFACIRGRRRSACTPAARSSTTRFPSVCRSPSAWSCARSGLWMMTTRFAFPRIPAAERIAAASTPVSAATLSVPESRPSRKSFPPAIFPISDGIEDAPVDQELQDAVPQDGGATPHRVHRDRGERLVGRVEGGIAHDELRPRPHGLDDTHGEDQVVGLHRRVVADDEVRRVDGRPVRRGRREAERGVERARAGARPQDRKGRDVVRPQPLAGDPRGQVELLVGEIRRHEDGHLAGAVPRGDPSQPLRDEPPAPAQARPPPPRCRGGSSGRRCAAAGRRARARTARSGTGSPPARRTRRRGTAPARTASP